MDSAELDACLAAAVEAARAAGAVLQEWRGRFVVREKGRFDLVTEADLAAQAAVRGVLRRAFPGHGFLGEEADGYQPPSEPGGPVWVVDPLDGTTNYVHDYPAYAVSIGLEIGGRPVVGVVYDPARDELFTAAQGRGAACNGTALRTSAVATLDQALLATGFPGDLRGWEFILDAWRHFCLQAQGMRRTGSTALNLAYVAAGRFDGFYAFQVSPWDVAAGLLLVTEAGGAASLRDGAPYPLPSCAPLLASNGPLHPAFVAAFAGLP